MGAEGRGAHAMLRRRAVPWQTNSKQSLLDASHSRGTFPAPRRVMIEARWGAGWDVGREGVRQ